MEKLIDDFAPDVIIPENSGVGGHIDGITPQIEVHDFCYSVWKIAIGVSEFVSPSIPPQLHDTQVAPKQVLRTIKLLFFICATCVPIRSVS